MAFFKNDWIPFVCSTDVSIAITSDKLQIRTAGDGYWKKFTYQNAAFAITLSGVLKFDAANWTGWDMIDNHLNFSHVLVRCSFDDKNGNVRTIQGYVMIESSTLGISPGALVKNDFSMQGNGKMDLFDGYVPCLSVVTSITVGGQTAPDGIVHITYTYTGEAYQIKYRLDGTGDYVYALADEQLDVPGLALGSDHSIEIIPVCSNGFEGTGMMQTFEVTQALTCSTVITAITILTVAQTATASYTGSATQMKYQIDGGIWIFVPITTFVSIRNLPVGPHAITMVPICSNNVEGTGLTQSFNVTVQPSQGNLTLKTNFAVGRIGRGQLYVNGVLTLQLLITNGGTSIVAPVGSNIKFVLFSTNAGGMEIKTTDITLSSQMDDQTGVSPGSLQFLFTMTADSITCEATLTH